MVELDLLGFTLADASPARSITSGNLTVVFSRYRYPERPRSLESPLLHGTDLFQLMDHVQVTNFSFLYFYKHRHWLGDTMSALGQLLDMGIPKSRARAALWRTNNDVMSAAVSRVRSNILMTDLEERIFAGEFDDIISDDEGGESLHRAGPDVSEMILQSWELMAGQKSW